MTKVRLAAKPGTRVDAGPTWQLLDRLLEHGWPKAWIAASSVTDRHSSWPGRRSVPSTPAASKNSPVGVGDMRCTPRRHRAAIPSLDELCSPQRRSRVMTSLTPASTTPHPVTGQLGLAQVAAALQAAAAQVQVG